jgi:LPXTG-motif cell wall-anchored protein
MRTVKVAVTTIALFAIGLFTALPAFAQPCGFGSYPPCPEEIVIVEAEGIAVTGAEITIWMLIVAGLVVVGLGALVAARRRARTA